MSKGRHDFPGGNLEKLRESVELVSSLDVEYLLPGHGNPIIGGDRVKRNFNLIKSYYF